MLNAYMEIAARLDGQLSNTVRPNLGGCCGGGVVQVALFKSIQLVSGLALPRDVPLAIVKAE